jgi:hypothetical protein
MNCDYNKKARKLKKDAMVKADNIVKLQTFAGELQRLQKEWFEMSLDINIPFEDN